ncbi:MAG: GAF domain-containing protein [Anaerolineae bacterium]|nr:GAF domain-containing protein [Anaerolineae bacterium]
MQRSHATPDEGQEAVPAPGSPFFRIAHEPLCLLDSRGRVREINAAFSRLLGYRAGEARGVAFLEWVHPQDRKMCVAVLGAAVANQQIAAFNGRLRDHAGAYRETAWKVIGHGGQLYLAGQPAQSPHAARDAESDSLSALPEPETVAGQQVEKLETAAEISVATAMVLETDRLLQEVVDVTRGRFDLYHAQVYLLNPAGDVLELAAGSGEVGRELVAEGQRIDLDEVPSLVASAARGRQGVAADNVQERGPFESHPLLPEARSALAVPMLAGTQPIGVFYLLADTPGRFDRVDVNIFTALATQVAVAIENARLFAQAQAAVAETNALMRRLTREGWESYLREQSPLSTARSFLFDAGRVSAALPEESETLAVEHAGGELLAEPLQIQDEVIGQLTLLASEGAFDEEDAELVAAIAGQLSARIENLRLTAETQLALAETAALYRAGTELNRARDYEEVVDVMREHSVAGRDASALVLVLFDEPWTEESQPGDFDLAGQWFAFNTAAETEDFPVELRRMAATLISPDGPTFIAEVEQDEAVPVALQRYIAGALRGKSALFVPLVVGGQWIGYLATAYGERTTLAGPDLQRLTTLAGQASVAIQSISLFDAAQRRAREERILREVSTRVRSVTDVDLIMRTAVREIGQALGRETFLYLGDEETGATAEGNGDQTGPETN